MRPATSRTRALNAKCSTAISPAWRSCRSGEASFTPVRIGNARSDSYTAALRLLSPSTLMLSPATLSAVSAVPVAGARYDTVTDRLFRLPRRFLPDPLAAMVEKELRTLTRIPRFRLVYAMSCFFGLLVFLPGMRRGGRSDFFAENALPVMALYGLLMLGQISYWNSFGFDRSAVQGYFSWPIRFRDALIGKNLTVLMLLVPQVFLVSVAGWAAGVRVTPGKIVEALLVIGIASLYWFGLGNICSVRLPRAMDPDKMNQMSNKMQAFTLLGAPFLLAPLLLAYWARSVFDSQIIFGGLLLVAAIVGCIFYWAGLDSAVTASTVHREKMLLELSRSDGPLSLN